MITITSMRLLTNMKLINNPNGLAWEISFSNGNLETLSIDMLFTEHEDFLRKYGDITRIRVKVKESKLEKRLLFYGFNDDGFYQGFYKAFKNLKERMFTKDYLWRVSDCAGFNMFGFIFETTPDKKLEGSEPFYSDVYITRVKNVKALYVHPYRWDWLQDRDKKLLRRFCKKNNLKLIVADGTEFQFLEDLLNAKNRA